MSTRSRASTNTANRGLVGPVSRWKKRRVAAPTAQGLPGVPWVCKWAKVAEGEGAEGADAPTGNRTIRGQRSAPSTLTKLPADAIGEPGDRRSADAPTEATAGAAGDTVDAAGEADAAGVARTADPADAADAAAMVDAAAAVDTAGTTVSTGTGVASADGSPADASANMGNTPTPDESSVGQHDSG